MSRSRSIVAFKRPPIKLAPEVRAAVVAAFRAGHGRSGAAVVTGVTTRTVATWLARDRRLMRECAEAAGVPVEDLAAATPGTHQHATRETRAAQTFRVAAQTADDTVVSSHTLEMLAAAIRESYRRAGLK